jgi:two-component system, NtrC family, sensor kinase
MKCPRCQHENRPTAKFCENCTTPLSEAGPPTGSYAHLKNEVETLRRALSEALEQQTATSEILRVISQSPTDLRPVFDAIVASSVRLCAAKFGAMFRFDGDVLSFVAHHNLDSAALKAYQSIWPRRPEPNQLTGTTILERRVLHVHDVEAEPRYTLAASWRNVIPIRTCLGVPILQSGEPIGVIALYRDEVAPFRDRQIDLVKAFADQAVIAIENARLLSELQASNRELTTALDTQTATSDILRVISSSRTDVQPVFDAIVASAVRLLRGYSGALSRIMGDQIVLAALTSTDDAGDAAMRAIFPQSLQSEWATAQAIRARAPLNIADYPADPRLPETARATASARGYRSLVVVPMLRHDEAVGTIAVTRRDPGGFNDDEIALLQTFADQAMIAIENARLLNELHKRNRDLNVALEQQTATSEILRVISSSPTDVQPVFDAIAQRAMTLCEAQQGAVLKFDGELIHIVAVAHMLPGWAEIVHRAFPRRPGPGSASARAIMTRTVVHIPDVLTERAYELREGAVRVGIRAVLSVPMVREGQVVGTITLDRTEPVPFSDNQIALLQTFADQAVIAIENVRLFKELEARTADLTRSVGELRALGEVGQAVSSTLDLETVLTTIVGRAAELASTDGGAIYEYDDAAEQFWLRAEQGLAGGLVAARREVGIRKGEGAVGRLAVTREPIQIADIAQEGAYQSPLRGVLMGAGVRSLLAVPLAGGSAYRRPGGKPKAAGRVHAGGDRASPDVRHAVRSGHPKREAVSGDRGEESATRTGQPAQVGVPG